VTDSAARTPSHIRRVVQPLQEFIHTEVAGGVILLLAALIAILWANSRWDESYFDLIHHTISLDILGLSFEEDLQHLVNDGLMTLFFFVVGLEIKRELTRGELQGWDRAALPAFAAVGGMLAPALIYTAINVGGDGADGWGIPMATDIAFALGLLAILGSRIPAPLRVFLLALAIVDDIGAILVIAVFYTAELEPEYLVIAAALLGLIFAMNRGGIRAFAPYFLVGGLVWLAVYESGIHATIAGVILGLMTPGETTPGQDEPPLDRLERGLHPITGYVIVPLFAFANAGIALGGGAIRDSLSESITIGVILGLVIGKPLGILAFSWLAVRTGKVLLPPGVTWSHMLGVGLLAGVGFTVALFINDLAFDAPAAIDEGKIGILLGSLIAAALGLITLSAVTSRPRPGAYEPDRTHTPEGKTSV